MKHTCFVCEEEMDFDKSYVMSKVIDGEKEYFAGHKGCIMSSAVMEKLKKRESVEKTAKKVIEEYSEALRRLRG